MNLTKKAKSVAIFWLTILHRNPSPEKINTAISSQEKNNHQIIKKLSRRAHSEWTQKNPIGD